MKKRFLLLTTLLSIALSGCGGCNTETNATLDTSVPVETASPEPTVEPTTEPTVEPTTTESTEQGTISGYEAPVDESTEEKIDLSGANDNDNVVSEGDPEEEISTPEEETPTEETPTVETPVEEPTEEEFKLTDEDIQVLKIMGATDSQIKAVKSQSDLDKLINLLINNGINGGGSGSGSGNNGGGSTGGNSGNPNDEEHDPSRVPQLDPDDGSLPGHM